MKIFIAFAAASSALALPAANCPGAPQASSTTTSITSSRSAPPKYSGASSAAISISAPLGPSGNSSVAGSRSASLSHGGSSSTVSSRSAPPRYGSGSSAAVKTSTPPLYGGPSVASSASAPPQYGGGSPAAIKTSSASPQSYPSSTGLANGVNKTGTVAFAGMNIAGFDFGCGIDGTCNTQSTFDVANKGSGIAQMQHFVKNDGLNAFRLPVSWQFLVNNQLGGPLDQNNAAAYDKLVNGCVSAGAKMCIVDIHNYARYNGKIIGQDPSGPTNDQYTNLLSQLATRYKNTPQVAFDIMNEPHNLDLQAWAQTSQLAVNAIRQAGATNHVILIPGTDFTSAGSFANNSGPALLNVANPDGSKINIIFNVHKYLDTDSSGTHPNCVTNNIASAFQPLAAFLRRNNRLAMLTETGGGPNDQSCMTMLCQQHDFINQNSDVFKGVISWAAGGFDTNYVLAQTPQMVGYGQAMNFVDQPLVTQCVVNKFRGATGIM